MLALNHLANFRISLRLFIARKEWSLQKSRGGSQQAEGGHQSDWGGRELGNGRGLAPPRTLGAGAGRPVDVQGSAGRPLPWDLAEDVLNTLSFVSDSQVRPRPLPHYDISPASPCENTSSAAF